MAINRRPTQVSNLIAAMCGYGHDLGLQHRGGFENFKAGVLQELQQPGHLG